MNSLDLISESSRRRKPFSRSERPRAAMPIGFLRQRVLRVATSAFLLAVLAAPSAHADLVPPMQSCAQTERFRCVNESDGCIVWELGDFPPTCMCMCPLPYIDGSVSLGSPDTVDPRPVSPPTRPDYSAAIEKPSGVDTNGGPDGVQPQCVPQQEKKNQPIQSLIADHAAETVAYKGSGRDGVSAPASSDGIRPAEGQPPTAGYYSIENNYNTTAVWDAGHDWVWHVSPDNRARALDGHFEHLEELNGERAAITADPTSLIDSADLQLPTLYQLEELAQACAEDECFDRDAGCTSELSLLCGEVWPDPTLPEPGNCAWTRTVAPASTRGAAEEAYAVCLANPAVAGGVAPYSIAHSRDEESGGVPVTSSKCRLQCVEIPSCDPCVAQ